MGDAAMFEDVMFDREPLGLADELEDLTAAMAAIIRTDEQAGEGEEIFFGLSTPSEEIVEVRALVQDCRPADGGFEITVQVVAADKALRSLAEMALRGGNDSGGKQPIWGLGLKQMNNTYAVLVNSPAGVLTAPQVARIAELSAAGAGIIKMTHAQRVILLVGPDQLESTRQGLEEVGLRVGVLHKGVRNIRACCGALCRFAQGTNALALATAVDNRLFGLGTEFDVKIAISDCMRNCEESYCADIGLLGVKGDYTILVGGRGSQVPFRGMNLVSGIKAEAIPDAVKEIVDWYGNHAEKGERFWKLLQRLGAQTAATVDLEPLKQAFAVNSDGVDEVARLRDLLARQAGVKKLYAALSFCG